MSIFVDRLFCTFDKAYQIRTNIEIYMWSQIAKNDK